MPPGKANTRQDSRGSAGYLVYGVRATSYVLRFYDAELTKVQ